MYKWLKKGREKTLGFQSSKNFDFFEQYFGFIPSSGKKQSQLTKQNIKSGLNEEKYNN